MNSLFMIQFIYRHITTILMALFNELPNIVKRKIYTNLPFDDIMNLKKIHMADFYEIPKEHEAYEKLYNECFILRFFPHCDNIAIAGGFMNIALDKTLHYSDFPTSDIDIFICETNMKEDLHNVLTFFDSLGATYKEYSKIINVYVPNYNRNFQIICIKKKNVYDIVNDFHTSNVKCCLHNGIIKVTQDYFPLLENRIAIIDRHNITANTLSKIINRGYSVKGLEHVTLDDLGDYKSLEHRKELEEKIEALQLITSGDVMKLVDEPCNFAKYRFDNIDKIVPFTLVSFSDSEHLFDDNYMDMCKIYSMWNKEIGRGILYFNGITLKYITFVNDIPYPMSTGLDNIVLLQNIRGTLYDPSGGDPHAKYYMLVGEESKQYILELKDKLLKFINRTGGLQLTHSDEIYNDRINVDNDHNRLTVKSVLIDHDKVKRGASLTGTCSMKLSFHIISPKPMVKITDVKRKVNAFNVARWCGYYWRFTAVDWKPDVTAKASLTDSTIFNDEDYDEIDD